MAKKTRFSYESIAKLLTNCFTYPIHNAPFLKQAEQREEHVDFFIIYRENMQWHDFGPFLSVEKIRNL